MERRFLFALFLSTAVLVVWMILFPSQPSRERPPGVGGAGAQPVPPPIDVPEGPSVPLVGDVIEGAEAREEVVVFGRSGEPGHYWATFSNVGARLVELRLGDYYHVGAQVGAGVAEPDELQPLVVPVDTPMGVTGSLLLATRHSSASLAREPLDRALWKMEVEREPDGTARAVRFTYAPGTGVVFTKTVRSPAPAADGERPWHLELELAVENAADLAPGPAQFVLTPAGCVPQDIGDRFYVEPRAVAVGPRTSPEPELDQALFDPSADDVERVLGVEPPLAYAGVHNKYFAFLMRGADDASAATMQGARYRRIYDQAFARANPGLADEAWLYVATDVFLQLAVPPPGERKGWTYTIYAGPKQREVFLADLESHEVLLEEDLGWFSGIGTVLLSVLQLLHAGLVHVPFLAQGAWGWSIILLTLMLRAVLFPLNRRSQTAMARYQKKMKRVQPRLNELKERLKNDPQKLRQEQARIMQEEGAFPPLGGCAPIFVQIPVFFGLFSMLRTSFELRQADFVGWIDDLSRPDHMFALDLHVPLLSSLIDLSYFNLLPILMVVLWILQQMGMPKPADEQAARMQKMMMFMPVMMGFFLYNYAAGLSLYMMTQSGLGIIEQHVIKKLWPIDDSEVEAKRKSGCGPLSGFMENLAQKQKEHVKRVQSMQKQHQSATRQRPKRKSRR